MRFREPRRRSALGVNLTSLIDVLFLLLIFVLLSAKFEEDHGLLIDLPRGSSRELPEQPTFVEIVLAANGEMRVDGEAVDMPGLPEALAAARERADTPVLIVKADRDARWETMSQIIDTAKTVGLARVAFKIRGTTR